MYMDESEQLYPEQSTTAIISYHPVARYFSAKDNVISQVIFKLLDELG